MSTRARGNLTPLLLCAICRSDDGVTRDARVQSGRAVQRLGIIGIRMLSATTEDGDVGYLCPDPRRR